jgi:PLP dependent protein
VLTPQLFQDRLARVHDRIVNSGGDLDKIRVVAVSKGHDEHAIRVACEAGQQDFGENYADELVAKAAALVAADPPPDVVWHFQGPLQRNKINRLIPVVSVWQTLDSVDRLTALATRSPGAAVMIQLDARHDATVSQQGNVSGSGRAGVAPADVASMVRHARAIGLNVLGLMTIAPFADNLTEQQQMSNTERAFRTLGELADELQLVERSMGMSGDLEAAVRAGSTMVRIGASLFGERIAVRR